MGNSGPSRKNKRAALGSFGVPGSRFMAPKGAKEHDTNMSKVGTLCGTDLNANKPIWDDWNPLRRQKPAGKLQFNKSWPFYETSCSYVS